MTWGVQNFMNAMWL